jgi:hypothetical protein
MIMFKKWMLYALLLVLIPVLNGCTSRFVVQVSAIAEPEIEVASYRYVLRNGNLDGNENDLFFREYSSYFIPILAKKGYQLVEDRDSADIEIFLRYAVSEGRTGVNTFSHPVYETIGGNTIDIVETKSDGSGGTTTTRSKVHIPLQTVYVGSVVESRSYTLYTSSAAIEAYKIKPAETILWKTVMHSTSEYNDLRAIMPVMAVAAEPYLAGNSGAAKNIQLKGNDPRVLAIQKNAEPVPAE